MVQRRVLSAEDGDLQRSKLISTRVVDYLDIDLAFAKKPAGDIYKKRDAAAVKQSVKNILLTNHYEKPFLPFFGSDLRGMLFELADNDTDAVIQNNITQSIEQFEPRAEIIDLDVVVQPDRHDISVTVKFKVINTEEVVVFTTNLARLR